MNWLTWVTNPGTELASWKEFSDLINRFFSCLSLTHWKKLSLLLQLSFKLEFGGPVLPPIQHFWWKLHFASLVLSKPVTASEYFYADSPPFVQIEGGVGVFFSVKVLVGDSEERNTKNSRQQRSYVSMSCPLTSGCDCSGGEDVLADLQGAQRPQKQVRATKTFL